nr:RING finger domain containing protein [Marseillevirus futianmevirus]
MSQCQGTTKSGERCKKKTKDSENLCFIHKPEEISNFSEECAICLGKFSKGSGFLLSCGHKFHKSCLKKLETPLCPCCRQEIKKEDVPKKLWPKPKREIFLFDILRAIQEEFGLSVYLYEEIIQE